MNQNMRLIARFAVVVVVAVILNGAEARPPGRIVGGKEGERGEFSYQASLRKFGHHKCGGTIISNRHILTAAHCVNGISDPETVRMTIMTGSSSLKLGVVSTVKTITPHPEFSPRYEDSWKNDIAVLTLDNEIEFGLFTKAARLPEKDTAPNVDCVVSGWGDVSYPHGWQPDVVRSAEMTVVTNARCGRDHPKMPIHDSQICALAPLGIGLCSGDSGGPMVHNGEVVGVSSFVSPCGLGVADVFTRVWSYRDFIMNAMADE